MTSFVKDPENAATPTAPGAPARPQPVALEVPIIVNGARAVDGSDKREPFSERSQTVLVFGHGAVIRVSAALAPGQLIFLTNEKSKKEVVCQVVKSKSDGSAVGYVELRFTEPAPGFWGMRFPSDTVLPQAAPRPAGPPVVPAAPIAPKAAAPAPPVAPVAPKTVVPAPPIALKPVTPVLPTGVPPVTLTEEPLRSLLSSRPAFEANAYALPQDPELNATSRVPIVDAKPVPSSTPVPASSSSSNPTTGELKQQAARLQEQLSSLLFAETPKTGSPDSLSSTASQSTVNLSEAAQKVFFETPVSDTQSGVVSAAKDVPPTSKFASPPLAVEEIKIPAWLAPLARETDASAPAGVPVETEAPAEVTETIAPEPEEISIFSEPEEPARRPETAMFGGQLLGESLPSTEVSGSKSRTGLFLGMAASLLLIAGGVWYSQQPGNAISGLLGGASFASHSSTPAQEARATSPVQSAQPAVTSASGASSASAPSEPLVESPATSTPMNSSPAPTFSRSSNFTSTPVVHPAPLSRSVNPASASAARNTPLAEEEAKKPSLGEVRLATPKLNNGRAVSAPGDSEPSIDVNQPANLPAPVSTLSSSHRAEPTAPAPVGGDVKPAKLIKSVPPVYPDMARNQRISGNVQIDALIDATGNVSAMKIISGPPLLYQAAQDAVKQWKFQPAELDGKATSMHLTVTVQFRTQ